MMIEKLQAWIVWHLPHWIVKWCSVRMIAHATGPKWPTTVAPEIKSYAMHWMECSYRLGSAMRIEDCDCGFREAKVAFNKARRALND